MTGVWAANLAIYSLQLTVLVLSALAAINVCRLRAPRPALGLWQMVLAAATLLPLFQPRVDVAGAWSHAAIVGVSTVWSASSLARHTLSTLALALLGAGALARIGWLAVGLARLRIVRRRAGTLEPMPAFVASLFEHLGTRADIRISDDIDGPVTVGLRRPLILLPRRSLDLPVPVQQAIVCHELLHVRRHDWASMLVEQLWCAALWFHPAAHLLVSRIGLMREALVDGETLAATGDRAAYARALLTFAEPTLPVSAAVPSLIRPRHLSRRIALITQETSMSQRHVLAASVLAVLAVAVVTAAGVSRFPMQEVPASAPAVSSATSIGRQAPVRPGGEVSLPKVVKEVRPEYTPAAMKAKIQGNVELDVVVLANGEPGEITVSRSLDTVYGLDAAAVRAASQWKFEPGRRKSTPVPVLVTLQMTFTLRDRK